MTLIRFLKRPAEQERTYSLLLDDIKRTKSDLELAYSNFENVVDPDLIDCCIYQVNAAHLRYIFPLSLVNRIEDSCARNPLELSKS